MSFVNFCARVPNQRLMIILCNLSSNVCRDDYVKQTYCFLGRLDDRVQQIHADLFEVLACKPSKSRNLVTRMVTASRCG